ncbi:MAG TPA: indole-3-glycerol phosphate synthase TrpC [Terriglobia bacterium]|nr:indole-3-glycerol phosphate synthase TrpC [Terriglobia bacterium]
MKKLESTHILSRIVEAKRQRLERTKMRVPEAVVRHFAQKAPAPPSLLAALQNSRPVRIIAEVKKASPSKGVFSQSFSVPDLVDGYTEAGASAISVVTEEDFFQGNLGWIGEIRERSALPVLRKDFVFDPYQIYETRNAKASAILLIAAMLRPDELRSLLVLANEVGLDALVEVHDEAELSEALDARAKMIGVNNRNLKTFEVDIQTSHRLARLIPEDCVFVVESGIRDRKDIDGLLEVGADAFLIGETLIVSENPGLTLRSLL